MTPPFKKGTPYTHKDAKPTSYRTVKNALAVKLNGRYRDARFKGTFEVFPHKRPFRIHEGQLRVLVDCKWFGDRPGSAALKVELSGTWELLRDYSGKVVDNIGEPETTSVRR
jgi:hypothetical protein